LSEENNLLALIMWLSQYCPFWIAVLVWVIRRNAYGRRVELDFKSKNLQAFFTYRFKLLAKKVAKIEKSSSKI